MGDRYTHGHHDAVLRSHRWRTAENSCGYLLPHLTAGLKVLDVGCGPGTITVDLARRVAPGEVVGIDVAPAVVDAAGAYAEETGVGNVRFAVDDVYGLDAADASFDVVHAHQVLQHLTDPVAALRELHRVLAPGGLLAVRDSDYAAFTWSPGAPELHRWLTLYHAVTQRNGAEADAGRYLAGWVAAAGFTDLSVSSSSWVYEDAEERTWWADLWAERTTSSAFAEQAVEYGLATPGELEELADGWRRWAAAPEGSFVVPSGEVLARRP